MEHFCLCSINTSHPLSPLSNQAVTIARWFYSLVPGNLARFTGLYHTGNCSTVHALLKERSGGSVARVGDNISVPRPEHVDDPIDTNQTGTQLSICRKLCFCRGQSRFRKRNRVISCRWDASLSSGRMFFYPVGFPSTFAWMEARKALKEKRQRLAGLIQKCLGIILMVSYKRTGLN